MANDILPVLKKRYNECLERNRKAEEYLKSHTVSECLKVIRKKNGKEVTTFDVFNEVVANLSILIQLIEYVMRKNMTTYEKLNGFTLGGD